MQLPAATRPSAVEKVPAPHGAQAVAPAASEYAPAGQLSHTDGATAPCAVAKVPVLQGAQDRARGAEAAVE